jgi:acetyl/propionyl-CoA carboxylase alpha subunit
MLAKLAAWGQSRTQAITRLRAAIREFEVAGIRSNLAFFSSVLEDARFCAGELHTGFIEEYFPRRRPPESNPDWETVVRAAMALEKKDRTAARASHSEWLSSGREMLLR